MENIPPPSAYRVKTKYTEKQRRNRNAYNRLLHASTGASTVGVVSGVPTIGTAFTVVGLPMTTSLATFETLISLSINDGTVIDAKEFNKLQTLYLQLMTHVRNIDRKMKVQTEENFQKTIMNEINNLEKALEQK